MISKCVNLGQHYYIFFLPIHYFLTAYIFPGASFADNRSHRGIVHVCGQIFPYQIEAVVYLYESPSFFGIAGRFKVLAMFNS